MKKRKTIILWGWLLMSLSSVSQAASVFQTVEKCSPFFFKRTKQQWQDWVLALIKHNPKISIAELRKKPARHKYK
ncbi:MAG: hypothetical protein OXB86_04895 [Bdellovibrionales bacterium]|nr:hypothetical protein [Bdellovibrionales bacterium]